MTKAVYWQRGESIDYRNDTEGVIEANQVVVLGRRIGVAGTEIRPGQVGSLHMTGVFAFPKKASEEITAGTEVYFDGAAGTVSATAGSGTKAGYAIEPAAADAVSVSVKINA